ncbi:hypothetical protein J5226_13545 [Lysobacter sp. K5869]|uniref:hypothetical protein n=1 Tax=Lysobacter sp. K5869 TaxID=2820808 RepID=UPI001C060CCE|nr:hypothetical protein [Lysobacter sp. K5869]QWP74711.1 hypothetical protein J5226_13545 [Lysobacter sp. K5869]
MNFVAALSDALRAIFLSDATFLALRCDDVRASAALAREFIFDCGIVAVRRRALFGCGVDARGRCSPQVRIDAVDSADRSVGIDAVGGLKNGGAEVGGDVPGDSIAANSEPHRSGAGRETAGRGQGRSREARIAAQAHSGGRGG